MVKGCMGILAAEKGIVVVFRYVQVFYSSLKVDDSFSRTWAMLREVCGPAASSQQVCGCIVECVNLDPLDDVGNLGSKTGSTDSCANKSATT
jgi:hypothetical protein